MRSFVRRGSINRITTIKSGPLFWSTLASINHRSIVLIVNQVSQPGKINVQSIRTITTTEKIITPVNLHTYSINRSINPPLNHIHSTRRLSITFQSHLSITFQSHLFSIFQSQVSIPGNFIQSAFYWVRIQTQQSQQTQQIQSIQSMRRISALVCFGKQRRN